MKKLRNVNTTRVCCIRTHKKIWVEENEVRKSNISHAFEWSFTGFSLQRKKKEIIV